MGVGMPLLRRGLQGERMKLAKLGRQTLHTPRQKQLLTKKPEPEDPSPTQMAHDSLRELQNGKSYTLGPEPKAEPYRGFCSLGSSSPTLPTQQFSDLACTRTSQRAYLAQNPKP